MIPQNLLERLEKLGLDKSIYETRSKKCVLSRKSLVSEKVPWYMYAYYATSTNELGINSPVFDPSSIVPCIALNPGKNDRILDMCAAPGTKTFVLSFMTKSQSYITANDIDKKRLLRLKESLVKYKINCKISNISGRKIKGSFNKILVDAPCSGEGMVNKSKKVFAHWSEKRIKFLAKKQKKLIKHAFEILEKGGTMVYSTCTLSPEENEEVIDFLLNKFTSAKTDEINVKINHERGIPSWNGKKYNTGVKKCMRIYPHHNETGGFFVAKIKKV